MPAHTDSDPDLDDDAVRRRREAQAHLDLALRAGVLAQAQAVREAASRAIPAIVELEGHHDPKVSKAAHEVGRVLRALAGQAALAELVVARDQGGEPTVTWGQRLTRWWRRGR